jgi:hypothetical protein
MQVRSPERNACVVWMTRRRNRVQEGAHQGAAGAQRPAPDRERGAPRRRRRFRLESKLPDDCDFKGVQARFEKGIVFVTMPGLKQEPVSADASDQQKPVSPADAAAVAGVQGGVDGDRAAPAPAPLAGGAEEVEKDQEKTKVQKEGAPQQRATNSAKDGGRGDDAGEGRDATPTRQGYAFLHGRKKTATTAVLGVVLVLISIGIYVKYSFEP